MTWVNRQTVNKKNRTDMPLSTVQLLRINFPTKLRTAIGDEFENTIPDQWALNDMQIKIYFRRNFKNIIQRNVIIDSSALRQQIHIHEFSRQLTGNTRFVDNRSSSVFCLCVWNNRNGIVCYACRILLSNANAPFIRRCSVYVGYTTTKHNSIWRGQRRKQKRTMLDVGHN